MALDTRPNLDNDKFEQFSDDELNLSGTTRIDGTLALQSGSTFNVQKGPIVEDNVLTSDASGNTRWAEANKNIPVGLEGEVIFYEEDNTKNFTHGYTLDYAVVVENDAELEIATGITPSFETIFNEWTLFSHYYRTSYSDQMDVTNFSPYYPYKINPIGLADPPTYEEQTPNYPALDPNNTTYPLTQSIFDSGDFWGYDEVNDRIFLTDNFNPYTGFISNDEYDRYSARVTMSSTDDDDDQMGIVVAFVEDEETGFQYTISAVRIYASTASFQYAIVYNYTQNPPNGDYYTPDFDYMSQDVIADGSSLVTTSGNDWYIAGQTIMEVVRDRDIITVQISQQGGTSLDSGTTLQIDLKDFSKLQRFRGPTRMGFGARSQQNAYFSDLQLSILGNYIFYVKNDGLTHDTYEFDNDTSSWFLQDPQSVTLQDYIGIGRFVYSDLFEKTYYTNSDGSIIQPMTGGGGVTSSGDAVRKEITQTSHGFAVGDFIGWSGGSYNKAIADGEYNGEFLGLVSTVIDSDNFYLTQAGYVSGLTSLSANTTYFLSPTTAGQITETEPSTYGQIDKAVLIAISSTEGWVLPYPGSVVSSGSTTGSQVEGFTINGDDTTTGFTINHNRNTRDVIVQVTEAQSPYSTVLVNVERPDLDNVYVTFTTAPVTGEDYRVLING